jgi:ligand-binding sensor domain-containing protein/serine phosphatase RsbU (regulator of sigma subunit)
MTLQRHILMIVLAFAGLDNFSQIYNFKNYNEDNGLSQSYIYQITQTSDGVMALSTGEGLVIYDGISFTTFTNKELSDNFVANHFQDSHHVFWLGMSQGGVAYLKNKKIRFLENEELKKCKVTGISEDKHHKIWISTSGGLFVSDTLFNVRRVKLQEKLSINSFRFDVSGNILAATTGGLYLYEPSTGQCVPVKGFEGKSIKQLVPVSHSGRSFWVLVEGEGIYGVRNTENAYYIFNTIMPELHASGNNISCMYTDRGDNLWVSLFGEGLRKLTFSDKQYGKFTMASIDEKNGLTNLYVQSIFQDFEGNMWFGTFGAGLIEKPIEKFTFYNDKDGLRNTNIKKPVIDKSGTLWIATDQGLGSYKLSDKSFRSFDAKEGFISDKVNTLFIDKTGLLWIGTHASGIYSLNTSTLKFEHFSKKQKLPLSPVNAITEGEDGNLFFGTGDGIVCYDPVSRKIKTLTTLDGLLHNTILNLFYDSKKRLWISSHGSPPYYMKDTGFTVFKDIADLKTFDVNAVCEDQKGNIWIATEGDGVFKYDGTVFSNYKSSSGLLSNYCYGILADNSNSVWVTHKNGLSEKKSLLKEFHSIGAHDGLLFTENNFNALYKDSIGDIWFGTTTGLIRYNSEIQKGNMSEPKISIVKVQINKEVYRSQYRIEKAYGFYPVRIDFLGVSFIDPEKIQYKFRLLGIDSLWKTTTTNYVDYPNLADGEYTFQVMARNSEGLWSSVPATVTIVIREPVWKQLWFYVVLLMLLSGLTYLIVQWRTNSLRKARTLLQNKVQEKTFLLQKEKEEVEKIKGELERHNKDITDSINYARRIQDSLLPPEEVLNDLFANNYFIFYKPKDIVSGDFYWAAPVTTANGRGYSLAAVADCTGHGVPGAFLSIVASNFLRQSLLEEHVDSPSKVLDFLNVHISSNLNQSLNNKTRIRDGMDIAMVAINYENQKLYYSGANNSIYIFRKTGAQTELITLKPTKRAIGAENEDESGYELKKFDLVAGDTIYLFSDGFADQFGGDKDKKLNYKRFKEILAHASELPINEQDKFLEQKFESWRGVTEQTDDVCVMGIRI